MTTGVLDQGESPIGVASAGAIFDALGFLRALPRHFTL
jgi:hypothetical protein